MESRSNIRGFLIGKLAKPFSRAASPSSKGLYTASKAKHSRPQPKSSNDSTVDFIIRQDQVIPPSKQNSVSFFVPDGIHDRTYQTFEDVYGAGGDESVDLRAASYISTVQERFRLERTNSEL